MSSKPEFQLLELKIAVNKPIFANFNSVMEDKSKLKLENVKQRVLPFPRFLLRLSRYGLFAFFLLSFSILGGTIGYHLLGKLLWVDSFHMSCMILTGMGPVVAMKTDASKIFSSLFALYSGVAFLSITAVFFAPIVHRLLHILHVENENSNGRNSLN